jgi:NAD/NADP transhydrogenase alpha subunit
MIAGVLRETAADERRVALTPADVRRLTAAGLPVVMQAGAGAGAEFGDRAYECAGARLVADPAAVFAAADLVAWVKPPVYELESMPLRPGQALIGFQDPIARAEPIARLRDRGVESMAFEQVRADSGADIDALSAMSRIAGEVAYQQGRGLLGPDQHARPVRSLVLGCGHAGLAAIAAAARAGDEPVAVGHRAQQRDAAIRCGAGRFLLGRVGPALLAEERIDLVICAAVRRGSPAPVLLGAPELAVLRPGAVVVDLVAKAGGNCVATVMHATVTLPGGVTVTHRSNYPALRPVAASHAYSAAVSNCLASLGVFAAPDGSSFGGRVLAPSSHRPRPPNDEPAAHGRS